MLRQVHNLRFYCWRRLHSIEETHRQTLRTIKTGCTTSSRKAAMAATLESLKFDNKALRSLPLDVQEANYVRQVSGACFSRVQPTPVVKPEMVAYSADAMALIDLSEQQLARSDTPEYLAGNKLLPGAQPAAHCYCGHQFGNFAGQLGDGATMYLGEVINQKDERWEIQFKGAGLTPYSRSADGRKVLRSSIREFLCSEAMHYLGIPTTRAGSCVTSDTKVIRDVYYTGNPIQERATIVLRIAQSFIRFGSFEICKPVDPMTGRRGPSVGRSEILDKLLDYVIETFYPQIWQLHSEDKSTAYIEFYREIVKRTAELVAEWQCVGWCHGVLNTDNMSIVGVTIDYGPYGFMDRFDRKFICNGSDDNGRYAYDQQPDVCKWNLGKLAEALAHLIPPDSAAQVLADYDTIYQQYYLGKMRKKMGLICKELPEDAELIELFLNVLEKTGADMTNCFRALNRIALVARDDSMADSEMETVLEYFLSQCCTVDELRRANQPRMDPRQLQMFMMLAQMNPDLLDQLGQGKSAIDKEIERIEKTKQLKSMTAEKKREDDREQWKTWIDKYTARLQLELTDGTDIATAGVRRQDVMNANNPKYILRNYMAQNAIEAAERGDYSEVNRVLQLLSKPYSDVRDDLTSASAQQEQPSAEASCSTQAASLSGDVYDSKPPVWALDLKVT